MVRMIIGVTAKMYYNMAGILQLVNDLDLSYDILHQVTYQSHIILYSKYGISTLKYLINQTLTVPCHINTCLAA